MRSTLPSLVAALSLGLSGGVSADEPKPLKVGIIGLDTSHVVAFTPCSTTRRRSRNSPASASWRRFPAAAPTSRRSRTRVAGYTNELQEKYGVEIVDSIDALLTEGRRRPAGERRRPAAPGAGQAGLQAGKPVFIDKPVAGSLADAIAIFELAKEHESAGASPARRCASAPTSPR